MAIYRNYDQAELDAQYDNGKRVPESAAYPAEVAAESAAARDAVVGEIGVVYGAHPRQMMDIFAGPGRGAPTLILIHGGYWQRMDVSSYSFPAPTFNEAGINYVALEYRLAPEVKIGDIVNDICDGLAWLWRNGGDHGIDVSRLFVAGHSAGGHLAAMAMAVDWPALGADLPSDLIRGGCAMSGLYDLEPIRLSYLNEVLAINAGDVAPLSPINNLAPRRLDVAVGGEESEEYLRQTSEFHAAWINAGGTGRKLITAGQNHFSISRGLADADGELFQMIEGMCKS